MAVWCDTNGFWDVRRLFVFCVLYLHLSSCVIVRGKCMQYAFVCRYCHWMSSQGDDFVAMFGISLTYSIYLASHVNSGFVTCENWGRPKRVDCAPIFFVMLIFRCARTDLFWRTMLCKKRGMEFHPNFEPEEVLPATFWRWCSIFGNYSKSFSSLYFHFIATISSLQNFNIFQLDFRWDHHIERAKKTSCAPTWFVSAFSWALKLFFPAISQPSKILVLLVVAWLS